VLELRHYNEALGDVKEFLPSFKREMVRRPTKPHKLDGLWVARISRGTGQTILWNKTDNLSPTPLIAAMRCYVASKLGDTVEIPEELTT
jgi:hypothetical protein